ncbi:MAG: hypothetical protein U0790_00570 [Isosphaeraceae bacterium]
MTRRACALLGIAALAAAIGPGCGGGDSAPLAKGRRLYLKADGRGSQSVTIESTNKTNVGLAEFVSLPAGTAVDVIEDDRFETAERREIRSIKVEVAEGPRKGLTGQVGRHKLRP